MIRRTVVLSPAARFDLLDLGDWVANEASPDVALAYINRIERLIASLELASERGTRHDHIRPGLRVIGFERRLTIAFTVDADRVVILRVFSGGRDWRAALTPS